MILSNGDKTTALPQPVTPAQRNAPPPQRGPRRPRPEQVLTTRVGLQIPAVLSYEEWARAGRQLAGVVDSSSWWLGDWLTYGKDHYADRYQQGIRGAGLRYQTLRNYAWVARRFDMSRRRPRLTFQHHAEVASLTTDEQDRWLSRAEERSWTTKQLRNALREARQVASGTAGRPAPVHRLAVPGERFERWHAAAERSGVEVDEWVMTTLDSAAERTITGGLLAGDGPLAEDRPPVDADQAAGDAPLTGEGSSAEDGPGPDEAGPDEGDLAAEEALADPEEPTDHDRYAADAPAEAGAGRLDAAHPSW